MKSLLFLAWLALSPTLGLVNLVLGAALAFGAAAAYNLLGPHPAPHAGRLGSMLKLAGAVAYDIVLSNFAVARIVFGPARAERRAGFAEIALETRHAGVLAALAIIVTATPGTSWAGYDGATGVLTLHVLDLADEAGLAAHFKARYERPLREIFE